MKWTGRCILVPPPNEGLYLHINNYYTAKGGSLMLIAATVEGGAGGVTASPVAGTSGVRSSVTASMVISSVLVIMQ